MILVTGGAGFIGSTLAIHLAAEKKMVVILDKLTYAGNLANLIEIKESPLLTFVQGDISDGKLVRDIYQNFPVETVYHCAAETHVDRSIASPQSFIYTNINGTYTLLEESLRYWAHLKGSARENFRFVHLSTDEVFGSLAQGTKAFKENSPYAPNSPYAASKASADHLVRSFHRTFQLPTLTTYSCNNFGPKQYPEKLIPLTIFNALKEKKIPLYGNGLQIRDWIFVNHHCQALRYIAKYGLSGENYNISAKNTLTNLTLVQMICKYLDGIKPRKEGGSYLDLITFVNDRPGHDQHYALDNKKLKKLGWQLRQNLKKSLHQTIEWYLGNPHWIKSIYQGPYDDWLNVHYEGLC